MNKITTVSIIGKSICAREFVKNASTHGKKIKVTSQISLDALPEIVDDLKALRYSIPDSVFEADVVLDYSGHKDMPYVLKDAKKVITQTKCDLPNAIAVETFCSAPISEEFGIPKFRVEVKNGIIKKVLVLRDSPCGAAHFIAEEVDGMKVEDAKVKVPLLAQYACKGFGGPKSSIHKAAEIHKKAFERAL